MIWIILLPLMGALCVCFLKDEKALGRLSIAVTALTLAAMAVCAARGVFTGMAALYGTIVCFMWLGAALLSPEYFRGHHHLKRYYFFFLFVFAATLGVFLAENLYTLFAFFELMSLGSYVWVAQEETPGAIAAGRTYLTISVLGGLVTLMGLIMLYHLTGTLVISELNAACAQLEDAQFPSLWWAALCLFFGFAAKAGAFPLHIWLPKAHPVAPAPASALLSGVLTKTGILGALLITAQILPGYAPWGILLLVLGTITMVLGAVMALLSNHLKYILACSSLSQIGFILLGVSMTSLLGWENALAANGTVLYMVNHSLVKLALFLLAGVVYANCHALHLNDIRGFGRGKPWLLAVFLCGGCSLAGVPGFCGYLSKTLVHESIVEYAAISGSAAIKAVEWLFLFSGGLTAAYLTKIGVALFAEGDKRPGSWGKAPSRIALTMAAVTLPLIGLLPRKIAEKLMALGAPFAGGHPLPQVHYFAWENLKGVVISLTIGAVVYFFIVRRLLVKNGVYRDVVSPKFDLESAVYLPVLRWFVAIFRVAAKVICDLLDALLLLLRRTALKPAGEEKVPQEYSTAARVLSRRYSRTPQEETDRLYSLGDVLRRLCGGFSFALLMACLGLCAVLVSIICHVF